MPVAVPRALPWAPIVRSFGAQAFVPGIAVSLVRHPDFSSRSDATMVAVGFNPRFCRIPPPVRRVATIENVQALPTMPTMPTILRMPRRRPVRPTSPGNLTAH